jgi:hypothetical protein
VKANAIIFNQWTHIALLWPDDDARCEQEEIEKPMLEDMLNSCNDNLCRIFH